MKEHNDEMEKLRVDIEQLEQRTKERLEYELKAHKRSIGWNDNAVAQFERKIAKLLTEIPGVQAA